MDTFKLVKSYYPEYDDSYYWENSACNTGFVIFEVQIQGNTTFFKIPAHSNSDGSTTYEFNKATPVTKKEKTVNVWE